MLGEYQLKHERKLHSAYLVSLVLLLSQMLGSYLLLADALRRLYTHLKNNTEVKINKRLICVYSVSTINYFICVLVMTVLTILAG